MLFVWPETVPRCPHPGIVRCLDPDNGLSDTWVALTILKRMARAFWEPLATFYRQNYHVMGTIGDPEPQNDHGDD